MDCLGMINLVLNLETYFSKTPGPEKRGERRQNGPSNPCLSSFIYLCEKREAIREIPISLLSPSVAATTFFSPPPPRPPIKCQWPRSRPRRPHLCWQRIQITSFSSVGLCFVKLGACWDPNGISLPFKLQPQTSCQWVRPSLRSSYFPNSLLEPILFDYNMAPTDRNDLPRSGFTSLTHLTFVKRSVSHRLTH